MAEPLSDSQREALEKAMQQFVDAQLDGQQPDIDVFLKQHPDLEGQLRYRIRSLQEIDGLFSGLMEADAADLGAPTAEHELVGKSLGDFRILRLIRVGGMGAVFLAHQASLDRDVALKVVSDVVKTRSRIIARFKREATALAKLSHPNIVPIYEVGQEGPYFYFAMEYVSGFSLDQLLDSIRMATPEDKASDVLRRFLKGQSDPSTATGDSDAHYGATLDTDYIMSVSKMMVSVASALEYAHQKGVLHRDVKPSNILIDGTGTPKLVDFGLARLEAQEKLTVTGEFFGTPSYTSPEQIRHPDKMDNRSDVYSLAATYYECLTLQPPFKADTVNETLTKTVFTEPVPPKKHCPRLSNDFNTVLLHALQKQPEDRYQTAAQFASDIENILSFKPILARRPNLAQRCYRMISRNPVKVLISVFSILTIVSGYSFLSTRLHEDRRIAAGKLITAAEHQGKIGNYAQAVAYYEEALKVDPTSARTYRRVALCYLALDQQRKEVEANHNAIEIDPAYTPTYSPLSHHENELTLDLGNTATMKLVQIPAGKFLMGSPVTEEDRDEDEIQHEVILSEPFYMGVTPVTVGQFAAFIEDSEYITDAEKDSSSAGIEIGNGKLDGKVNGCWWRNPGFDQKRDHPVVLVSWNDARAFCVWLSSRSGKMVLLPTEAQWEYACRAGATTAYPWGESPDSGKGWANVGDQSLKKKLPNARAQWSFFSWDDRFVFTSPVSNVKGNAFGLCDMIGNVWQWCQDYYGDYDKGVATNPTGPETGDLRVLRGGSWGNDPGLCRSAYRDGDYPDYRFGHTGFRVVVVSNVN
jgi:formylglycine-generating enzyme required for sulfatase activity/serine/threonine protein kinase